MAELITSPVTSDLVKQDHERDLFLSSRSRHPPDDAACFVETRFTLPGQPRPVFSEWCGSFVPLEEARRHEIERKSMWSLANDDVKQLLELLQRAQSKLSCDKGTEEIHDNSSLRLCGWAGVIADMERMARQWKTNRSNQGKTMLIIDRIGQRSSTLESWLALLPNGDYGSSVCGVFKLIIGAAGHYSKIEQTVLEALEEIPITMDSSRRYVLRYGEMRSQRLEKRTVELFLALLSLLRHVVQYFLDQNWKKVAGAMLLQGGYKQKLSEALSEFKKKAETVTMEAEHCQSQQISDTQGTVLGIMEDLQGIAEQAKKNDELLERVLQVSMATWRFLQTDPRLSTSSGAASFRDPGLLLPSSYDIASATALFEETEEGESTASISKDEEQKIDILLESLEFDPEETTRDIENTFRFFDYANAKVKSRAAYFVQSNEFKEFMQEQKRPRRLLVNGREDLATAEGTSPLRLVLANMARYLSKQQAQPVYCVQYFCSEHNNPFRADPAVRRHASPASMMASLIGQLISQMRDRGVAIDLAFLVEKKRRRIEKRKLNTLCEVFRALVAQVPWPSTLICIIDEISIYDIPDVYIEDTDLVMEELKDLTKRRKRNDTSTPMPIVKLLVTCRGGASLRTAAHFQRYTLHCPSFIEANDSADYIVDYAF